MSKTSARSSVTLGSLPALEIDDLDAASAGGLNVGGDKEDAYPSSIQAGIPRLGKAPRGWNRYALGDLLKRVERPARLLDAERYQLVTAKRNRGGIIAREVLHGNQIRTKTQFYVQAGDFLVSNRQISHGACGVVPSALDGSIVSNEYSVFHTTKLLEPAFLEVMSHSIYFQQTCFHSSIGVTVEKLVFRLDEWMKWEFDIPDRVEQRRIASLLAVWDKAIQQTEQVITAQKKRRTAISQILFRPSFSNNSTEAGCKSISIGEAADCFSGGTPDRRERMCFGGGIPWVKSGEIVSAHISDTEETLSEAGLASSSAKWVPTGSTLIAMYGANAGQVGRLKIEATTNQAILAIVPNIKLVNSDYMYHAVVSVIPSLMRKVQGSGQPNLSAGIVKDEKILVPSKHRQEIIANTATALADALNNLQTQLIRFRVQKRGLIQKLLSGNRRLAEESE